MILLACLRLLPRLQSGTPTLFAPSNNSLERAYQPLTEDQGVGSSFLALGTYAPLKWTMKR